MLYQELSDHFFGWLLFNIFLNTRSNIIVIIIYNIAMLQPFFLKQYQLLTLETCYTVGKHGAKLTNHVKPPSTRWIMFLTIDGLLSTTILHHNVSCDICWWLNFNLLAMITITTNKTYVVGYRNQNHHMFLNYSDYSPLSTMKHYQFFISHHDLPSRSSFDTMNHDVIYSLCLAIIP